MTRVPQRAPDRSLGSRVTCAIGAHHRPNGRGRRCRVGKLESCHSPTSVVPRLPRYPPRMQAPSAWQPHEGALLRMRADTRFGADGLPDGWWFGRVSAVVTDADGLVYVAHRGPAGDPIVVLDAAGRYVRSWGRGRVGSPHGLRVAPDGAIVADRCRASRGDALGARRHADAVAGHDRCRGIGRPVLRHANGRRLRTHRETCYVSDGYGNSRVVRFRADGRRVASFGSRGTGPTGLHTPHSLIVRPGRPALRQRPDQPPHPGVRGRRRAATQLGSSGRDPGHRVRRRRQPLGGDLPAAPSTWSPRTPWVDA